ncbi:hypothetical protein [Roseixanthobacter glucoisosaccharinicivorans]|uniref:hypothetical protein n=1 Tax=Roseixanthobacter glucoisosaccharinicivorans TaxID=3119923 RepID=UPI00372A84CA
MPTFYVTKHALTSGTLKIEAEKTECDGIHWGGSFWNSAYGEGRQWSRTEAEALVCAEKMRVKKIASLKKQIEKLETAPIKIVEA